MNKRLASWGRKFIDFVAEQATFRTATTLIVLTSAGWLASSLAQVAGIYRNKNYTKEEKSFMIPQELADAAVNIGTYLLVTLSLKELATKMVETGKLAPKSIVEFLKEKGKDHLRGNFDFKLTSVEGFNAHRDTYNNFKTLTEATASITGGILSSNIITPILRNKIAANRKGRVMEHLNTREGMPAAPTITPVSSTPKPKYSNPRYSFDDFRNKVTSKPTNYSFNDFRAKAMGI